MGLRRVTVQLVLLAAVAVSCRGHLSRLPGPFSNAHLAPLPSANDTCQLQFSLSHFDFDVSSLQLPTGEDGA